MFLRVNTSQNIKLPFWVGRWSKLLQYAVKFLPWQNEYFFLKTCHKVVGLDTVETWPLTISANL